MNYYLAVFKKFSDFSGRSKRAEFWYFFVFNFSISILISIFGMLAGKSFGNALSILYSLVAFVPGLALNFRRLHDIGKSASWLLLILLPLIGPIWLLVLFAQDSAPGDNKYGPNPKGILVK